MKMNRLLCGIDIGTTGAKAALFQADGRLLGEGYGEYPVYRPRTGWAEQDPADWWRAACEALQGMMRAARVEPGSIAAVAVSAQAPTMLPLDAAGRPVRRALIWMDRRAEEEARFLGERLGEEAIFAATGNRVDPFYVAAKLLWFRRNEPELFAQTRQFVQINGYIAYRLTGALSMDPVHASLLQLRRWQTGEWLGELCSLVGVEPDRFPPIVAGEQVIGTVAARAADESGLAEGTPVVAGSVDGSAAALEAGAIASGEAAEMTGTSTVLLMPNDRAATSPAFIAMPHAVAGAHLLLGAMSATGASLKWFRDGFGAAGSGETGSSYDRLTAEAAEVAAGSEGVVFLPYMAGERSPIWDTDARGVFFGLTLATGRGALIRAILEGAAFALRHNVEVAGEAGLTVREIRSVGGGARSRLWNQIKADVLGRPILIPERFLGAPFGDALLAGLGCGEFSDIRETVRALAGIRDRYEPDPTLCALYDERYGIYRELSERLRPLFGRAARAAGRVGNASGEGDT